MASRGKELAAIVNAESFCGLIVGGWEHRKWERPNGMIVYDYTPSSDIEEQLKIFLSRGDIDVVVINQPIAEVVRHVIDAHTETVPIIVEIPPVGSPEEAFEAVERRAMEIANAEDLNVPS